MYERRRSKILPMEIIYVDSLFFLNLIADYLLCLGAAYVCGLTLRRPRYFLAALLGAAWAVAVYLPGLGFLASPIMKLVCALLMCLIAYGAERRLLRCTAAFLAVSAAFGGALWALSMAAGTGGRAYADWRTFFLAFALCYAALRVFFTCTGRLPEKKRVCVKAGFLGREAEFIAMVDTGNSLTDPATGAPVLIACPAALKPILKENAGLFAAPAVEVLEKSAQVPELRGKLRLIPYSTLDGSGLLPAFRPDSLSLDGKPDRETLIAVSPGAAGDGYEAIV